MPKKYKFRKVYFMCSDNQVIEDCYEMVNAYRRREYAEKITQSQQELDKYPLLWEKEEKKPKRSTEGFYLVHESLFDEILKPHVKDFLEIVKKKD